MRKVSGIILTHNNERTIKSATNSIKGAVDELLIIDDFSSDKTIDIIKSIYPSAIVFQRALDRFDSQRNFAIEKAKYEWILMIDSDEEADSELAKSIKKTLENPKAEAYSCVRLNEAFDKYTKEKINRPILFKNNLRFEGALHEIVPNIELSYLGGFLIHHSWTDAADWINDMNHYSTHTAKKWLMQNRNYTPFQLALIALFMPPYVFFKMFLGQKRYKNGFFVGFLYPLASSTEWFFAVLKYYEIKYIKKDTSAKSIK